MGKYWDRARGAAEPAIDAPEQTGGVPPPSTTVDGGGKYWSRAIGAGEPSPTQAQQPSAVAPQSTGFFGGIKDMIVGKRDPRFVSVHGMHGQMVQERNQHVVDAHAAASLTGASDAALGDIYQNELGDRFISREQDENGYEVMTYRGQDRQPVRGYVNRPGLEMEDVSRTVTSTLPYMAAGGGTGVVLRGAGTAIRAGGQAITAGATSLGNDVASGFLGSQQGPDLGKAAIVSAGGAAGELVAPIAGAAWRRFVTEPKLFNRSTGQLTEEGAAAAKAAGYDPAQMTADIRKEFAKTYARTDGDASAAIAATTDHEFGIPSTLGQRTKDSQQLLDEKAMRYGLHGQAAKEIMTSFDQRQLDAVKTAAIETSDSVRSIAGRIAPERAGSELSISMLGPHIRSGMQHTQAAAKAAEKEAWDRVPALLPKPEAFGLLSNSLMTRLGTLPVDEMTTPTATAMARSLDDFVAGKASSGPVAKVLDRPRELTVDQMRRRLLGMSESATTATNRKAAQALYAGFNDWIDTAARQSLLSGDVEAAAALRTARDASRTLREVFSPTDIQGRRTPAARIIDDVIQRSDSAEGIVTGLFGGGPAANVPDGTVDAVRAMRRALGRYAKGEAGAQTWNDIRAAYWVRLVRDKTGEMFTPGQMLRNVKLAQNNQATVMKELYGPAELAAIGRFRKALEQISYKDPNPSGSGVAIATYAKQFLGKVLSSVPFAQAALEYSGLPSAFGRVGARQAVSPSPAALAPTIGPYVTSGTNALMTFDTPQPRNALMPPVDR